jgi:HTH-type transcriptional repressor of NAD biosynthesis genes
MSNAIVLMTALVPTVGHKALIDFASHLNVDRVFVLVGALEREPIDGWSRANALISEYAEHDNVVILPMFEELPQEPHEHPDFWNVWAEAVRRFIREYDLIEVTADDVFVASELYGVDMARVLGCRFMPYNRYREVHQVKGSIVREDLLGNFSNILEPFQSNLIANYTLIGPESCGKTTMAKRLAAELNGWFLPEWAREYLETVGAEITHGKMEAIAEGQYALQQYGSTLRNKPFVFQDTDLIATYGFLKLSNMYDDFKLKRLVEAGIYSNRTFYLLMNDAIPFEADQLRYGGDRRESDVEFWRQILEHRECSYAVVPYGTHEEQFEFCKQLILDRWKRMTAHIQDYRR